jgi:hypothetical protein
MLQGKAKLSREASMNTKQKQQKVREMVDDGVAFDTMLQWFHASGYPLNHVELAEILTCIKA